MSPKEETFLLMGGAPADIYGNTKSNLLSGNNATNRIFGRNGEDTLFGYRGYDLLDGGIGHDYLDGGANDDVLIGGTGADELDGGSDNDTASYAGSNAGVTVSLATGIGTGGHAQGDTLAFIENLTGSSHGDRLTGNAGPNRLSGEAGDDILEGGAGADVLDGGADVDTASYANSLSRVVVSLSGGTALDGHAAGDTLISIENLTGSAFNDELTGSHGANVLNGMGGSDRLTGGLGPDIFVFDQLLGPDNIDTITDFRSLQDRIALDRGTFVGLATGALPTAAFKDIGTGEAIDGSDRIIYDSTIGALFFDRDGAGTNFDIIQFALLENTVDITASDFMII